MNYLKDIKQYINFVEETHPDPYLYYNKTFVYSELEKLSEKDVDNDSFYLEMRRLTALIKDSHTVIRQSENEYLAINFKFIDDKLYAVESEYEDKSFLYNEITAINNISINEIYKRMEPYISYEKDNLVKLKIEIEDDLTDLRFMKLLNIITGENITINYRDKNNQDRVFNNKVKILTEIKRELPYSYKVLDKDIMYIRYASCRSNPDLPFKDFVAEVKTKIVQGKTKDIIVDIRGNMGGSSEIIGPLIDYLNEHNSLEGNKTTVIIDERVFSSGTFAILDFKETGCSIIGSPTGAQKNHFGEVEYKKLNNSKLWVGCSSKFWLLKDNQFVGIKKEGFKEHKDSYLTRKQENFEPDYIILNTINDIKNNIDVPLNNAQGINKKIEK
jgi:hypothetical protein